MPAAWQGQVRAKPLRSGLAAARLGRRDAVPGGWHCVRSVIQPAHSDLTVHAVPNLLCRCLRVAQVGSGRRGYNTVSLYYYAKGDSVAE